MSDLHRFGIQRPVEMKLLKHSGYIGAIGALVKEDSTKDFDDVMNTITDQWKS